MTVQPRNVSTAIDDHDGHEDRRDPIGQPLGSGLAGLGVLDELDDLRQRRLGADRRGPDREHARGVDRGTGDVVADLLVDRQRLAGEHRFVDGARSVDDLAVDGHLLARPDLDHVADLHRLDRHHRLDAVADQARLLGAELDERPQRLAGSTLRTGFEVAAEA